MNRNLSVHMEKDFIKQAFENYDCRGKPIDLKEFEEDFSRARVLCKIIKQSKNKKAFNTRLLLNYFVIVLNCFNEFGVNIIFYNADESIYPEIIAFLKFINRMPLSNRVNICGYDIDLSNYTTDLRVTDLLLKNLS